MARKSSKSNPTNASEAMEMILSTEPLKTVAEAAEFVGVAEIRVLELFADTLNLPEAMGWEVIPQEHEHLLNEFKAQASDIQVLPEESTSSAASEMPVETPVEPPILEDEPQPKKRGGRPKKEVTALTQQRKEGLEKKEEGGKKIKSTRKEVKRKNAAQRGQKSGAQLAAIELTAEQLTYEAIQDQALRREIAIHATEISEEAGFNPLEYLKGEGLIDSDELFNELRLDTEELLGKFESATAEIVENSWMNGYDLEESMAALDALMN